MDDRGPAGSGWTAIVLAGQRSEGDPMAAQFGVTAKALIPVAGEPMLGRVVRSLLGAPSVARLVILAQRPDELLAGELGWIARDPRVSTASGGGGISRSVGAIAGSTAAPWPVLVTTADHPLLTPEMIEGFLGRCGGAELSIGVVERKTLLARYPLNRRTWLPFRGGAYTGANLFALLGAGVGAALAEWAEIEADRKKALKLVWHFGPLLALGALTRTITLQSAVARAGRRLGLSAAIVTLPYAEAAIDVDKASDLALAEEILGARGTAPTS